MQPDPNGIPVEVLIVIAFARSSVAYAKTRSAEDIGNIETLEPGQRESQQRAGESDPCNQLAWQNHTCTGRSYLHK